MADTSKEKILKINTGSAEKNVKSLKTQIRELKEQLAGLEKGTAEYDKVSKQLADTNQKQIEINEAMRYSNKDFGQTLSNLTSVSAGVVGAISSINSVMVLMGADSEEAMEAMKKIQAMMAIIQGLSAIDTATKALKGLTVAFKGFNTEKGISAGVTAGAATAEVAEAGALAENTKEMIKNNEEGREFNRLNKESADASKESALAIAAEKEAMRGNTEATRELVAELEKLKVAQAAEKATGMKKTSDVLTKELTERKAAAEALLATVGKDGGKIADRLQREIGRYDSLLASLNGNTLDATEAISLAWRTLSSELEHNIKFNLPVDEVKDTMKAMVAAMSPEQIEQQINRLTELMKEPEKYFGKNGDIEAKSAELTRIRNENYTQQIAILEARKAELAAQAVQEKNLEGQIRKTTNAENAETAAIIANSNAKKENAGATTTMGNAEAVANKKLAGTEPVLAKLGSSIKNAAKSIVSFVKANPILLAIAAAIGAIVLAVSEYTRAMKKANAEIKLMADLASNINEQYDEQRVRIYTLTSALEDNNSSVEEHKKAAEELNKIIPNYNAQLDETTGKYTANKEALDEYLEKLYQKIKLEAYEGKIKEYLQQQLELEEKINKMENSGWKGWNKFWGRISKAKNDIQDLDMQIDRLFKRINDEIDLSKALDENKNGGGGIKKTFTELFDDLKSLWKEFYKQITQTKEFKGTGNALRDSLMEAINGNLIADKLSDQFRQAMKKGFKDLDPNEITPDFVFDEEYLNGIREKVEKEKETLQNLLKQKKVSQEIIDQQKKKVQETQKELDKVNEVTNAAKAEAKATHEIVKARRELAEATVLYNKQLDIERNYVGRIRREQYREFQYEETNKEIEQQRLLYKNTIQRLEEEKQRRIQLKQQKEQGLDVDKEILQTEKNIAELQKTANEAQIKMDNLRYQKRLTQIQEIYAATEKEYALMQQQLESERNLKGGGVSDYNTEVDLIELQLQSITARANAVTEYYDVLMAQHEQYTEEWYVLEQERNAAMEALEDEYRNKSLEKDRAYVDRKLNIQKTYINLYSAISGQISNILSAEMDMYDSNTEEYKKLKYRQGIISTAEGVLGAFMSGVESGVPAPWNLLVAAAMAATTLTAGIMQLNNIKNEKVGGTMPKTVDLSSREYDTLAYAQGADTLSAIQDQRCYVLESDITSTQNRVEVRESQAAF